MRTETANDHHPIGPYSRRLRRGITELFDGRSAEGRFVRHLEAELVAHCGGVPSITQRLLIERLIRTQLQLDLFDEKMKRGTWTELDGRTYGGLLNAYRLIARELGLKSTAPKAPTLAEALAAGRKSA